MGLCEAASASLLSISERTQMEEEEEEEGRVLRVWGVLESDEGNLV